MTPAAPAPQLSRRWPFEAGNASPAEASPPGSTVAVPRYAASSPSPRAPGSLMARHPSLPADPS